MDDKQIILGIDPGSKLTGWGIIASNGDVFQYIDSGVIATNPNHSLPERLEYIYLEIIKVIQNHAPTHTVIEDTFAHKFFKASLVLAQAQAVAILACQTNRIDVKLIQSKTVKKILTGNGNADKEFVNHQLRLLIPNIEFQTNDASDALAIALAYSLRQNPMQQ